MTDSSNTAPMHVVLTGAAGALGRAVAQHFLAQGARLALLDHHAPKLSESFPELADSHHPLMACDVTSASSMQAAAAQVLTAFQTVDTVVHIAGGANDARC